MEHYRSNYSDTSLMGTFLLIIMLFSGNESLLLTLVMVSEQQCLQEAERLHETWRIFSQDFTQLDRIEVVCRPNRLSITLD